MYTYLVDSTEYAVSGMIRTLQVSSGKSRQFVPDMRGAFQYMMERLGIPCIYVDGDARGSAEGHAWDMISLDGEYYYVDATNGEISRNFWREMMPYSWRSIRRRS